MSENNSKLHITVDRSRCCAYGLCAQICPEIYKLDDDGIVYLEADHFPIEMQESAEEGAASCPAEAIVVQVVNA